MSKELHTPEARSSEIDRAVIYVKRIPSGDDDTTLAVLGGVAWRTDVAIRQSKLLDLGMTTSTTLASLRLVLGYLRHLASPRRRIELLVPAGQVLRLLDGDELPRTLRVRRCIELVRIEQQRFPLGIAYRRGDLRALGWRPGVDDDIWED